MRVDPWFARRWGFTGYGSTPLHYPLHPSIEPTACQCERRHYGGLRIVIVSRIAGDRPLRCRIRANVRSNGPISAKMCSLRISASPRIRSDLSDRKSTLNLRKWQHTCRIYFRRFATFSTDNPRFFAFEIIFLIFKAQFRQLFCTYIFCIEFFLPEYINIRIVVWSKYQLQIIVSHLNSESTQMLFRLFNNNV